MNCKEDREVILYAKETGCVRDPLDEATRSQHVTMVCPLGGGSGRLRLLEVPVNKVQNLVNEAQLLETITMTVQKEYPIEEVPADEVQQGRGLDEMLLPCAHFHKEVYQPFGTPFYIKVRDVNQKSTAPSVRFLHFSYKFSESLTSSSVVTNNHGLWKRSYANF
jgi:ubiquitin carboxyl-terminal hydrolase 7